MAKFILADKKKMFINKNPLTNNEMFFNKTVLIGLGIVVGIYLLYKLLFTPSKFDEDYQRHYDKILTSDEYKVKGQYDK